MRTTAVLTVLLLWLRHKCMAGSRCGLVADAVASRIVGGHEVGGFRYPWFAILQIDNQTCGAGTLISRYHVLTAAHVLKDERISETAQRSVLLGVYNQCRKEEGTQRYNIAHTVIHENYSGGVYDIGIITLDRPTHFTPACLPKTKGCSPPPQIIGEGRDVLVAGYGVLEDDLLNIYARVPCTMREAYIRMIPKTECLNSLLSEEDVMDPTLFCAGLMSGGSGICTGDSGGGLLRLRDSRYVVEGIAVGGETCGAPNSPSTFTNVTYFMKWIRKHMARRKSPS